jgi:stage V sporulation protein SpoVS
LCDLEADDDEVAGAAAGFVYSILRMRGGTTVQRKILGVAIVRCFLAAAGINLVLSNSVRYACEAMDAEEDVRRTLSSPLSTQPRVDAIFLAYLAGRAAKSGWMGERGRTVLALPAFWSPAP